MSKCGCYTRMHTVGGKGLTGRAATSRLFPGTIKVSSSKVKNGIVKRKKKNVWRVSAIRLRFSYMGKSLYITACD